ncbi:hypothetical protein PEC302107_08900 [Pectobacterium araliae]|uniref:Uncharacterized protein n=1 Tax=Pectobacterium araliae TaxID=3073862 RepID=A0AAN0MIT9_9GAMM|nr:hypothetical protein PEC302110_00480 [Pectobacterium sp. MAFF 302110]GKW19161.1 hypothetical protein PEC302107_08900 [Pectobacterium carotovorum subsp. carotovorum]
MKPENKTEEFLKYIADNNDMKKEQKKWEIEYFAYPDQEANDNAGQACATCPPPHARKSFVEHVLHSLEDRYMVAIYIAYPGTPLNEDSGKPKINKETGKRVVSAAGHMWFEITKVQHDKKEIINNSYGFAPINSGAWGNGFVTDKDTIHYEKPYYKRTIEITENHYKKLKEFGDSAYNNSDTYFDLYYNGVTNSCIDFTWKSLRHAGLSPSILECKSIQEYCDSTRIWIDKEENKFDDGILVGDNQIHVRSIPAPFPHSELNKEINNPPPLRSDIQKIISGLDPDSDEKQEASVQYTHTLPPNYGVNQLVNDWSKFSR